MNMEIFQPSHVSFQGYKFPEVQDDSTMRSLMIGMQLALLLSHEHHELRAVAEKPLQFGKDRNGHDVGICSFKSCKNTVNAHKAHNAVEVGAN